MKTKSVKPDNGFVTYYVPYNEERVDQFGVPKDLSILGGSKSGGYGPAHLSLAAWKASRRNNPMNNLA